MTAPLDPATRAARRFGLVTLPAGLGGASVLLWLRTGTIATALPPALLAAASAAVAAAAPSALGPVHHLATRAGEAAARLLTWLLLAAIYFTAFTAASLVARALGYDALRRRIDREAGSHWLARPSEPDAPGRHFDPH